MSNAGQVDEIRQSPPDKAAPDEVSRKEAAPEQAKAEPPGVKGRALFHRPGPVLFVMLLAIAGIIFAATVFLRVLTHESTDDAFIDGHVILIAPKISGKVSKVNVTDNQEVKKGDTLLEIDPRDYQSLVDQKKAALDVASAKEKAAGASVQQSQAHVQTLLAGLASLQASADASKLAADLSHSDLKRSQSLIKTGVVSSQDFEHAKSAADTADANLLAKTKEVESVLAYSDEAKAQMASNAAQAVAAQAEVDQARAELAQAELQRSYTTVTAPEDGHVTSKAVEAGDYLQIGQTLLAIVPHEVWVTANFKETQITDMRPGQPVMVLVDAYPGRKLRGHVDSMQAGSGSRFSLLPPENATGNFVKVVQRVPAKIVFDEQTEVQRVLGPGMSAVPEVLVKGETVPALITACLAGAAILAVIVATLFWLGRIRREPDGGQSE